MSIESSGSTYLSPRQAGAALNVSRWTVYRLIEAGLLKALRVGIQWRISTEEIAAYQRRHESQPLPA